MVAKDTCLIPWVRLIAILMAFPAILVGYANSEPDVQAKVPPGTILLTGAGATFPSVLYNRGLRSIMTFTPRS